MRITKGQKTGECGTPLVPCKTMQDCVPKNFPNLNLKQKCVTLSGTRKVKRMEYNRDFEIWKGL